MIKDVSNSDLVQVLLFELKLVLFSLQAALTKMLLKKSVHSLSHPLIDYHYNGML